MSPCQPALLSEADEAQTHTGHKQIFLNMVQNRSSNTMSNLLTVVRPQTERGEI